jgi:hypothetical protein
MLEFCWTAKPLLASQEVFCCTEGRKHSLHLFYSVNTIDWPPLWSSGQSSWLHNGDVLCFLWGTNWIYISYVKESRPPLWSSGQSYWLHNGDVLCFLWGTKIIYISYVKESRLPLWSSGQSSWLRIQRFRFDSRCYQIFWEVVGLERGSLSLVSTAEELLVRKSSGSGLESREYGRRELSRWPRGTLYPQNLALTSPTCGGRSVGIVRSRTPATEISFTYNRLLSKNWNSKIVFLISIFNNFPIYTSSHISCSLSRSDTAFNVYTTPSLFLYLYILVLNSGANTASPFLCKVLRLLPFLHL